MNLAKNGVNSGAPEGLMNHVFATSMKLKNK